MATDKWIEFNGVELVNLSRTAQLASVLGIDSVWVTEATTQWIEDARNGEDYDDITAAPWYDPKYPASAEFAGVMTLGFPGLDDSTTEATTVEYTGAGGRSGGQRNSTLPIVASVALVASTDRGADYGKRWLDRTLRGSEGRTGCSGADMRYYRYPDADAPVAHRRQVRLTRGVSVTRKRSVDCSVTWLATFTVTCDDPYEYGEPIPGVSNLGGAAAPGGPVLNWGTLDLVQQSCPAFDYTPVFDPLYPALVPAPSIPALYPAGWTITDDQPFRRYWARVTAPEPTSLLTVPLLTITSDLDVRMVRVSVWSSDSETDDQCDPLFSVVVSYVPAGMQFIIDGEQSVAYVWDGFSPSVRRTDSLVFSPDAKPVEWAAFNDDLSLLVTLDVFTPAGGAENIRLAADFIPKSD